MKLYWIRRSYVLWFLEGDSLYGASWLSVEHHPMRSALIWQELLFIFQGKGV